MSTRIPPAGFELHGYSLIEPLPHETGELEAPIWLAEETDTLDQVLIATLGAARLGEEARRVIYDRCLRLSRLEHPSLPGYLDSSSPDSPDCFVAWSMPPAAPLRDRLAERRGDLGFALRLTASAARGLSVLHDAGEVHGGLSPAVLAVGDRNRAFLLASGVASLVLDDPGLAVAARYRAPEQLLDPGSEETPEIGPAADVWALGVVLYELVEGTTPHSGGSVEEVRRAALALERPPLGVADDAPRALLGELIARTIAPDPAKRFPDAGEMADCLDELCQQVEARTVAQPSSSASPETAAAVEPLVVTAALDPSWRPSESARRVRRAPAPPEGVPLLLWIVPTMLLLALVAFLLWWVDVF